MVATIPRMNPTIPSIITVKCKLNCSVHAHRPCCANGAVAGILMAHQSLNHQI
jgi:hypothetical protein